MTDVPQAARTNGLASRFRFWRKLDMAGAAIPFAPPAIVSFGSAMTGGPAARARLNDTDGRLKRLRHIVDQNRLL